MNRLLMVLVLVLSTSVAFAKKVTFDLVQLEPPAAYKKKAWEVTSKKGHHHSYTVTDQDAGTYCRITVYQSTESKGDIEAEFLSEWTELTKSKGITAPSSVTDSGENNGWKIKGGVAPFEWNGGTSMVMLTTYTGHGRTTSILIEVSSEDYFPAIEKFLTSVKLNKPPRPTAKVAPQPPTTTPATTQRHAEQYQEYNTMLKRWVWKWRYPKSK